MQKCDSWVNICRKAKAGENGQANPQPAEAHNNELSSTCVTSVTSVTGFAGLLALLAVLAVLTSMLADIYIYFEQVRVIVCFRRLGVQKARALRPKLIPLSWLLPLINNPRARTEGRAPSFR